MAVQFSTAVRNAQADAYETAMGVSVKVRLYSGTKPANCAAALSGNTLLAEFALASDWAANAGSGAKTLNGLPLSTTGVGAGNASFYRFYDSAGTTCHEQGNVVASPSVDDMIIDNVNIAVGQSVQITGFTKTWPGA